MSRAKKRAPAKKPKKRSPAKTRRTPRRPNPLAEMGSSAREVWIAEMHVVWVDPGGARRPGHVAVGAPYSYDGYSMCQMSIDFEKRRPQLIAGYDHMQALLLAVRLIGYELYRFTSTGGRAVYPDDAANAGADIDLDAVFGPLLQTWPSE